MTPRERITAVLNGEAPDRTPFSIYGWFFQDRWDQPEICDLSARGLVRQEHVRTYHLIEHEVRREHERREQGADVFDVHHLHTPVGSLRMVRRNGWHHEDWIKTPADYRIRRWIVEHTEVAPAPEPFDIAEQAVGDGGVTTVDLSRSPMMSINIDWAGTQQFSLDLAEGVDELMELFEAQKALFLAEARQVASGPGRFVKVFENLTIGMLGPQRYRDHLLSVYREAFPLLRAADKRVFVHYDGALAAIRDDIAQASFDGIESIHEPPEGDLTLDACRAAWPDKVLWAGVNLHLFDLPLDALKQEIAAKRERAGKAGVAFEISEDLPAKWAIGIPAVLETLEQLD